MGGKRNKAVYQQACSASHAVWPREMRRSVPTGRAAQSKRLLIMNGVYLTSVKVKKRRYCVHCNSTIEYISYVRMTPHFLPISRLSPALQIWYLSLISALLAAGLSLTILILHHWSLVLLLALVWLVTAYITSHLLARDMRLLKRLQASLQRSALILHTFYRRSMRRLAAILAKKRPAPPTIKAQKVLPRPIMPSQFPDTPMPATPLIRVLETIDLSTTSIEHFLLEDERQTSAEFPAVHELEKDERFNPLKRVEEE